MILLYVYTTLAVEYCNTLISARHVNYCMQRVNLLRDNGVKPVIVFDGGRLPMKQEEESTRQRCKALSTAPINRYSAPANLQGFVRQVC